MPVGQLLLVHHSVVHHFMVTLPHSVRVLELWGLPGIHGMYIMMWMGRGRVGGLWGMGMFLSLDWG